MPDDALDQVLRLVAEGRLTAEEAGPLLDALDARSQGVNGDPAADRGGERPGRVLRIEVSDAGRKVINLRVPLALGRAAISQVPGISEATSDRIREAIAAGIRGPIVDVDDGGDGVRISIE
jgi:SHOCT-like protein